MDQVGAEQIAQPEGAVEVEVGTQALGAGGAAAGVVQSALTHEQWLVGQFDDQLGLAGLRALTQAARHGHTGQVVGQQEGAVDGVGIERRAHGLLRINATLDLCEAHARGWRAL